MYVSDLIFLNLVHYLFFLKRFQRYSYQPPSMLTDLPPTGLALEVTPILQEHFRFRNYNELLANSNTQLPGNSLTICFSYVHHCNL
ncbi:hypothetical protein Bca4012_044266 [Brassica carinata]|uniref:Uncharacterized protein n=2 Tax=Brassica TaxID=3705 RepID=A0A3P6EJR9_BRAOL|nr:hypothetical protein HID58_087310 [Brassica napus]CAF1751362.1 unnamed protein product [Brassica napus]VDD31509.1 unnamed protein product [Brassica oleracea]